MHDKLLETTGLIVSGFLARNRTSSTDVPLLIQSVHRALRGVVAPEPERAAHKAPAVDVRRSVTPDFLICLEDGERFKSLKRHLRVRHELSPIQYRERWALRHDYPMVAPSYSVVRSNLAKSIALGQGSRRAGRAPPTPRRGK